MESVSEAVRTVWGVLMDARHAADREGDMIKSRRLKGLCRAFEIQFPLEVQMERRARTGGAPPMMTEAERLRRELRLADALALEGMKQMQMANAAIEDLTARCKRLEAERVEKASPVKDGA